MASQQKQYSKSAMPAYHRVYVLVSEGIKNGVYPPGELLPSENALADTYQVSRITIRRALDQLVDDGLVTKRQGQGSIVTLKGHSRNAPQRVSGLLSNLVAQGADFTARTLFWDTVAASSEVCQKLSLPAGAQCLLIRRLRFLDEAPISYASIYLPEHIGTLLRRDSASHRLILQMLDDTPYPASQTEYSLSAALADGESAQSLELTVGTPVLQMRGIAYSKDGVAVYYQESVYRPDRYEYAVKLQRDMSSGKLIWRHGG